MGGLQCLAVVVELAAVVEDHEMRGRVAGIGGSEDHVDRIGQVVDTRGENGGLGLEDDRLQLRDRRAGLQRDRHGADEAQRDVNRGVVDAGEPQHADPVTGCHKPISAVSQSAGQLIDAVGQLAVADFVEPGQQRG